MSDEEEDDRIRHDSQPLNALLAAVQAHVDRRDDLIGDCEMITDVPEDLDIRPSGWYDPLPATDISDDYDDDEDEIQRYDIRRVHKSVNECLSLSERVIKPWPRMLSVLLVCGSVRFTVEQYENVRAVIRLFEPSCALPSYCTVQRIIFPYVLDNFLEPNSIEFLSADMVKQRSFLPRVLLRAF